MYLSIRQHPYLSRCLEVRRRRLPESKLSQYGCVAPRGESEVFKLVKYTCTAVKHKEVNQRSLPEERGGEVARAGRRWFAKEHSTRDSLESGEEG